MRVLKQIIEPTEMQTYMLPGSIVKPLCVKLQNANIVMYFETDASDEDIEHKTCLVPITVGVTGTGCNMSHLYGFNYLGTVMMPYGLVWHCYVRNELSHDI